MCANVGKYRYVCMFLVLGDEMDLGIARRVGGDVS